MWGIRQSVYFAGHGKKYIPVERLNIRSFALGPPAFYIGNMTQPPALFDPYLHHANRLSEDALFLHKHAAEELYDRLKMVNKTFTKVAIVTGHGVVFDNFQLTADIIAPQDTLDLGAGEYDLILHFMALHRQNDPVGQLIQINRALRPDGLFLGACFGGKSLEELRAALLQADSRINNGAAPRVAPMMDIRDAGALMQRAGFAMPVVDSEETNITYPDLKKALYDLRHMGESNPLAARSRHFTKRAIFGEAQSILRPSDHARLGITAEVLFFSGWAPSPDQPKPLKPGSAAIRLEEALRHAKDAME